MSKTNDTSNLTMLDNHRPLADSALDAVAGDWTYTKQKPDGTAAGNVAAKWSLAQGAVS